MREIKSIVVHCSATPKHMDIGVSEIREWHKKRGWSDIGYHYVIRRNGVVEDGRPVEQVGAHVKGHNKNSIGICLVGGIGENQKADANFTLEQYNALDLLVYDLMCRFGVLEVYGHRELNPHKECPCFDVNALLRRSS